MEKIKIRPFLPAWTTLGYPELRLLLRPQTANHPSHAKFAAKNWPTQVHFTAIEKFIAGTSRTNAHIVPGDLFKDII